MLYRLREEVILPTPPLEMGGMGGFEEKGILDTAIRQTLLTAGKAIIFVATALAAGGVTLLFTGYYLHMEGFLVPLAMLTSSLATLIVLPAVVALVRPGFIYR